MTSQWFRERSKLMTSALIGRWGKLGDTQGETEAEIGVIYL